MPDLGDLCGLPAAPAGATLLAVLLAGVLAGLSHCAGMCGPLAIAFAARRNDGPSALILMQTGRIVTYAFLGQLMGFLGSLTRGVVVLGNAQGIASVVLGAIVLLTALALTGVLPLRALAPTRIGRALSGAMRRVMQTRHPAAPFGLGVANALLPCGATATMLLMAAASANPWQGGLILLVFGLGTLPALAGISALSARISPLLRGRMMQVAAALLLLVGVQLMLRGFAAQGLLAHASLAGVRVW